MACRIRVIVASFLSALLFAPAQANFLAGEPPSVPVVAIDVGHTLKHPGAISARGEPEFFFNQRVALKLERRLSDAKRVRAFVINRTGEEITLTDRVELASKAEAQLFVSIHHDSVQPQFMRQWTPTPGRTLGYCDDFRGFSVFVSSLSKHYKASAAVAGEVGRSLVAAGFAPSTFHGDPIPNESHAALDAESGVYLHDHIAVLRCATTPAILVECGVIVNREEELQLKQDSTQSALVEAIADAIERYFAPASESPRRSVDLN